MQTEKHEMKVMQTAKYEIPETQYYIQVVYNVQWRQKDTKMIKLSGCLSLSVLVKSRPFRNPCTSAASVCMDTGEEKQLISRKELTN